MEKKLTKKETKNKKEEAFQIEMKKTNGIKSTVKKINFLLKKVTITYIKGVTEKKTSLLD